MSKEPRVFNQAEIDSLLGPDDMETWAAMSKAHREKFPKDNIIAYLRAQKCDLKNEAADILERAAALLEGRPVGGKKWNELADGLLAEIKRGRMYD